MVAKPPSTTQWYKHSSCDLRNRITWLAPTLPVFHFQKGITANVLKDLVEFIVCKIPPLPVKYLAIWNNNEDNSSPENPTQEEISRNLEKKAQVGSDKDDKRHENTPVIQGKKRKYDATYTYVNTRIKSIPPRETPKVKKKKSLKTPK